MEYAYPIFCVFVSGCWIAYIIGHNFGRRRGREESMDMARYWREMFWTAWEEDRPVRRFGETANRG